ncbi:acetyl-CoA synthetase, putative [Plasmodium gallinaceum]|uniref:acetate--CoA ligase n=1 Tax=Plasmodium gallinaceum TaxID=5849 RepID=A0A1J1GN23_PLAGA|nr:acetyl-CoA synthetase, putative [Plasmodium gallinaceum]CRG93855.1 acetyl-CoA synthetase, putative [Plasmodium gallinaceum]
MNNINSHGNISKIDSGQISSIDIDESIFINRKSYPVNELYEDENKKGNNQIENFKSYKEMYEESIKNPELFWGNIGRTSLRWFKLFTKVYSGDFRKGNVSWFVNGKINACENCVDRWAEIHPNKTAIIWEKDNPNEYKKISYQKLLENTCRVANLLKIYGVKKQDTVTIYLPMIPELVYSMLACARLGAIHNVVFAGYSAGSLSDRIIDSKSKILITCDFGLRGGKLTKLKKIADAAMDLCGTIEKCIVFKNKMKINESNIYLKTPMQNQFYHSASIDSQNIKDSIKISGSSSKIKNNGSDINENVSDQINNNSLNIISKSETSEKSYMDIYAMNNKTPDKTILKPNSICSKTLYPQNVCTKADNTSFRIHENGKTNNSGDIINNGEELCSYNNDIKCKSIASPKYQDMEEKQFQNKTMENIPSNFDENICTLKEGRDVDGSSLMKNMRPYCPIEYVDSEDFLCLLYTSGSTGKPKGVAHTTSGYLLYAYTTCKYIFDVTENDIFGCVADIGWVTGHSYVLYGPLLNGITTVLFSSIPTYPDCGRYWNMIETHKVTQFYTAPTALRALMKHGDHWVENYDLSSCRILGSVGEPINPETWRWYYNVVGKKKCVIVDTYWQTETGGIVIAPIPNLFKLKPGCATLPFFGVELEILDSKTLNPLKGPNVCGLLCIKSPWPGMLRTVYGNHNRLIKTYFATCPNYYFTGDGAYRDEDGYYWISGRIDDTLNVSGHRLGAAEIEHALVQHFYIAEAAVVSFFHKVKGEGILCFVVKKKGDLKNYGKVTNEKNVILSSTHNIEDLEDFKKTYTDEKLIEELKLQVRQVIGPIATPDLICIVPDLPKTRSGKIIRRILRCIANGLNDYGDITTVANYEIIDVINNKFNECKENFHFTI